MANTRAKSSIKKKATKAIKKAVGKSSTSRSNPQKKIYNKVNAAKRKLKNFAIRFILIPLLLIGGVITFNQNVTEWDSIPSWNQTFSCLGVNKYASGVDADFFSINSLKNGETAVYFFDVGQGDSSLIVSKDHNGRYETFLIDTGESNYYGNVSQNIRSLGIDKLDYILMSHPHSDHAGGMPRIIEDFSPDVLYLPELTEDSMVTAKFYADTLKNAEAKNMEIIRIGPEEENETVELPGNAKIYFMAPVNYYGDLNNLSIVLKLVHGENRILFTGDIEKKAEKDILASNVNLSADVIKIAHHGSSTSSYEKFLDAVNASVAVIQVGADNSYKHPSPVTIENLNKREYQIFRTDEQGNIGFLSDGKNLSYRTEKNINDSANNNSETKKAA